MADEDDQVVEHTLLVVREVNVYKVPTRATSGGYKCAEWLVSSKIWSGRLRIVSVGKVCEIRLEDPNSGELFATCPVLPGQRESSVQNAVDSSRYFVLRVDDGRGRHAFLGLGFNERNEAFDFNVALTDHDKHAVTEQPKQGVTEEDAVCGASGGAPSHDFKLKEGETIKINIKTSGGGEGAGLKLGSSATKAGLATALAPPPGMKPLAPPPGMKLSAPPPSSGSGSLGGAPPHIAAPSHTTLPAYPAAAQSQPLSSAPSYAYQGQPYSSTAPQATSAASFSIPATDNLSAPQHSVEPPAWNAGQQKLRPSNQQQATPAAGWTAF